MYTLKKENKDFKKSVIEKEDVIEFTIEEADKRQAEFKIAEREWEAQIRIDKAMADNVARNHPKIAKMPEGELFAARMYLNSKEKVDQYTKKLKELKGAMKRYVKERQEILDTFGWTEE